MTKYDYPYHILKKVQEYLYENNYKVKTLEELEQMEPQWILSCYLEWEGIIGYTQDIINILYAEEKEGE